MSTLTLLKRAVKKECGALSSSRRNAADGLGCSSLPSDKLSIFHPRSSILDAPSLSTILLSSQHSGLSTSSALPSRTQHLTFEHYRQYIWRHHILGRLIYAQSRSQTRKCRNADSGAGRRQTASRI